MKKLHLLLMVLSIGLFLGACSLEEDDDEDENNGDGDSELIGMWDTGCTGDGDGVSQQATQEFGSDDSTQAVTIYYDGNDCESEDFRELHTGEFEVNEDDEYSGEFWLTSSTSWHYQLNDAEMVGNSNNGYLCGLSDWQIGVAKIGKGPYTYELNSTTTRYVFGIPDIPEDIDFSSPETDNYGTEVYGDSCYSFDDIDPSDDGKKFQYTIDDDTLTITSVYYDEESNEVESKETYYKVE